MPSLLKTTLAAALLFTGFSTAAPAVASDAWTITFSNATATGVDHLCGANPHAVTFGPGQLNKCTPLGNTFTRWVDTAVGQSMTIRENCIRFFDDAQCTGGMVAMDDVIGATLGGQHCKAGSGNFDAAMYSDDCPTGSGG